MFHLFVVNFKKIQQIISPEKNYFKFTDISILFWDLPQWGIKKTKNKLPTQKWYLNYIT